MCKNRPICAIWLRQLAFILQSETFLKNMEPPKDYAQRADQLARKNGYFCASFIGTDGTREVYSPRYHHNEVLTEGLPNVIVVSDDGEVSWAGGYDSFPILGALKEYRYTQGKRLYQKIARQPKTADEQQLVAIVEKAPDKERYYDYLELAKRLQMPWQMNGDVMELVYRERVEGPTPNGGDYSEAHYYDEDRLLCPPSEAKYINIVEYTARGERVYETYGVIS